MGPFSSTNYDHIFNKIKYNSFFKVLTFTKQNNILFFVAKVSWESTFCKRFKMLYQTFVFERIVKFL